MTHHRIGLDVRMLENSGIGTYLRGLLSGFQKLGLDKGIALFGGGLAPFTAPIYSIQEQFQYPSRLKQCRLWHAPHYNVPLLKGKTKVVVTIHDIIHWIFRKQFLSPLQTAYAGFMLGRAVRSADHIIAVSHHTKKDLVEHFHAPEEKVTVIHQGVDETFRKLPPRELEAAFEKVRIKYGIPEKYFFMSGSSNRTRMF
jgi:glycosyltransferase involved in cell wall biosynthesis